MNDKRKTLADQKAALLETHKKKLGQINAQIKAQEAREKTKQRKLDTRRKIIIGALAMNHAEKNRESDFTKKLNAMIDEYVIKDNDRDLLGLDRISEQEQKDRSKKHAQDSKRQSDMAEV